MIILFGLNLLGVLFILVKGAKQPNQDFRQESQQQIVEKQRQLQSEINELNARIKQFSRIAQKNSVQPRVESKIEETSAVTEMEVKKDQNLFLNDRYKEIFELKKQGLAAEEIAKKLDKGLGEVSLILELAAQEQD